MPTARSFSQSRTATALKLKRAARMSSVGNLFDNSALAGGYVTVTDQGTKPGSLPKVYTYSAANVNFNVLGGTPKNSSANPTRFGVRATSDVTGSNGNLGTVSPELSRANALEFVTDAQSLYIRVTRQTAAGYRIAINGQYVDKALQVFGTADAFSNYILINFTAAGVNRVRFESDDSVIYAELCVAQNRSIWPVNDDPVRAAWISDSYGTGYNAGYGWFGFAGIASQRLGWEDPRMLAVSGTGYTNTSPVQFPASDSRRLADLLPADGKVFDVIPVALGGNDTALTASDVTTTLAAIRAQVPGALIPVFGPWPFTSGPSAGVLAKEATIAAAVASLADPMIKFAPINTDPAGSWFFGTTTVSAPGTNDNTGVYIIADGTHPNKAGHEYLGRRTSSAIRSIIQGL